MKKKAIDKIILNVTGYNNYGFIDHINNSGEWKDFVEKYFTRDGTIDGHSYTSELNKLISTTAMLQTLAEVRKRLLEQLEGLEQVE